MCSSLPRQRVRLHRACVSLLKRWPCPSLSDRLSLVGTSAGPTCPSFAKPITPSCSRAPIPLTDPSLNPDIEIGAFVVVALHLRSGTAMTSVAEGPDVSGQSLLTFT